MLSAVFRSTYLVLSTPVVGDPLPISLSGNLRNGLGINTTMKKIFIFVQCGKIVLVLVYGASERLVGFSVEKLSWF